MRSGWWMTDNLMTYHYSTLFALLREMIFIIIHSDAAWSFQMHEVSRRTHGMTQRKPPVVLSVFSADLRVIFPTFICGANFNYATCFMSISRNYTSFQYFVHFPSTTLRICVEIVIGQF